MPHLIEEEDDQGSDSSVCSDSKNEAVKKKCLVRLHSHKGQRAFLRFGHVMFVTPESNCAVLLDPMFHPVGGESLVRYVDVFLCPSHTLQIVKNPPSNIPVTNSECPWYYGKYQRTDLRQERRWRKILSITIGHTGHISSKPSIGKHIDRICAGGHTAQFISPYMSKQWAITNRWHQEAQRRKHAEAQSLQHASSR